MYIDTSVHQLTHCLSSSLLNRISLSKLMEKNETFRQAMVAKFTTRQIHDGKVKSLVDRSRFNNYREELLKLYSKLNYYPQKMAKNATLDESFEFRPETFPFIQWFGCARTWKDSINCDNLTRIESVTSRKCTTLLHRGAMLYDAYNRPELFNTSRTESNSLDYFDAKEVIKLVLNFEPEDYADLKRQIGARILFHDSNYVASSGDLDFFVTRGYRYDFSIDRRDTQFNGKPYLKCLDYYKMNMDKYKTRVEPRVPLESQTCYQNCVTKNIINRANCWPPTLPYFRNDSLDPDLKMKFCPWHRGSHSAFYYELVRLDGVKLRRKLRGSNGTTPASPEDANMSAIVSPFNGRLFRMTQAAHLRSYRKINRFCLSKCILSCRIVGYTVSVTRSAWPSDVKILFDPSGKQRLKRHCCALIAIKFTHFHYNIHEHKPKHDIANTIGDLGGLLAFWLGLSILSLYHAIQKLIELCNRQSLNKIRDLRVNLKWNDE